MTLMKQQGHADSNTFTEQSRLARPASVKEIARPDHGSKQELRGAGAEARNIRRPYTPPTR